MMYAEMPAGAAPPELSVIAEMVLGCAVVPAPVGCGVHTPPWQRLPWQSALVPQASPPWQVAPHEPPQSTSDSLPFLTPSVQPGSVVVGWQKPPPHSPEAQSWFWKQRPPIPQAPHEPPQSMSDSLPFRKPSSQLSATTTQPDANVAESASTINRIEDLLRLPG